MNEPAQATRRGRGRPSKGPRDRLQALVPVPIASLFKEDAEAQGRTETDHLVAILADYYRLELEAPGA